MTTVRVPQPERTRLMRARLLEATVDCLVERGWSGTSTTVVSQRAGVSRGAQLHHFPTKNDLVLAAVEHLSEARATELQAAAETLPTGPGRTRAVLDMMAEHFISPIFTAALELWVAARTDAQLLAAVGPLEQRVGRETHRLTVELLGVDESRPGARELVQATLDLVRGLGLANTISDDRSRRDRILDAWAAVLDQYLVEPAGTSRRSRTLLDDVLDDLAAQAADLDALLAPLTEAEWRTATPAVGWDIAHQVVHLAWTDEVAVLAATDKGGWDDVVLAAVEEPDGFVDTVAASGALASGAEILSRWRTSRVQLADTLRSLPEGHRMPWFGPPMSATSMATARFMETWAHSLDVADALGVRPEPTDRIRHVVHLGVRTRDYSFANAGRDKPTTEFRVELTAPSGAVWTFGPKDAEQRVTGSAVDFALLVTQRRHRADLDLDPVGADADAWLDLAQAFAGPPGGGRQPT